MGFSVSAASAELPISLGFAKDHIRVSTDADDTVLRSMIGAAASYIEETWNRALVTQTLVLTCNGFSDTIELPRPPLASVSSITYIDGDGNSQTLAGTVYTAITDSTPGRIERAFNQAWPTVRSVTNNVTITYVAGYGDRADVPDGVGQAVAMLAAWWYEHREAVLTGTISKSVEFGIQALMGQFRAVQFV